jgi:Fe2+ transport system protein FeoA
MGLLPGREIRRENTAPLGDPVAYLMDGEKISIRRAEAQTVEIELV